MMMNLRGHSKSARRWAESHPSQHPGPVSEAAAAGPGPPPGQEVVGSGRRSCLSGTSTNDPGGGSVQVTVVTVGFEVADSVIVTVTVTVQTVAWRLAVTAAAPSSLSVPKGFANRHPDWHGDVTRVSLSTVR